MRRRQLIYAGTHPDPYSDAHANSWYYARHLHHRGDRHARYGDFTRDTGYGDRDGSHLEVTFVAQSTKLQIGGALIWRGQLR